MRGELGEREKKRKMIFLVKKAKKGRKHCHLLFSPPLLRSYGELILPYASRVTLQFNLLCGALRPAYLRIAG